MTRRIHLQLAAIVSNDGARCAAECPHRDGGYGHCTAFDRPLVMDLGHGAYDRCPTCIAAEQAAASVPSCEGDAKAATLALRNVRALATRLRRTDPENAAHLLRFCESAGVVGRILRDDDDHLDGGARALDASEALREARVQGMREALEIVRVNMHIDAACADILRAIEAVRKGER